MPTREELFGVTYDGDELKSPSTGDDWLKLEAGQSVVVAFLGKAVKRVQKRVWDNEEKKMVPYDAAIHEKKPRTTFPVNVATKELGEWVPKIWDMSATTKDKYVHIVVNKYPGPRTFEVSRTGTGFETQYTILPEGELTEDDLTQIEGLTLADLTRIDDSESEDTSFNHGANE